VREASQLFSDDLLEDVPIEREVRHQLLQFAVFVAQRPQLAHLLQPHAGELLLPPIEALLADAEPAADLGHFLAGLDLARLYLALRKRPSLTIADFLREEDTFYRVTFPASPNFDLPKRYPWLSTRSTDAPPPSWEVSFNRAGIPLKAAPGAEAVPTPQLSYFKKSRTNYSDLTRGVLGGSGDKAFLSESGQRLMQLLTWPE